MHARALLWVADVTALVRSSAQRRALGPPRERLKGEKRRAPRRARRGTAGRGSRRRDACGTRSAGSRPGRRAPLARPRSPSARACSRSRTGRTRLRGQSWPKMGPIRHDLAAKWRGEWPGVVFAAGTLVDQGTLRGGMAAMRLRRPRSGNVGRPVRHERATPVEQVAAPGGGLDAIAVEVRQGELADLAGCVRALRRPVTEARPRPGTSNLTI